MIEMTECCGQPLFLRADCIGGINTVIDDGKKYSVVYTTFGEHFFVAEGAEVIALLCDIERCKSHAG